MCEGECKVQFYDVDISEVVVTPDPSNAKDCPKAPSAEDIADALQPYYTVIGCKEADCECILYTETVYFWAPWQVYDVPAGKEIIVVRPEGFTTCKYTLSGTYYVSSGTEGGVCMKKPKDWKGYERKKNSKGRPKKAGEKPADKPKKKAGHKKAGYKISRRRRTVRLRPRGRRRGTTLG